MTLLLLLAVLAIALLLRQNFKLEKRWRALRYCWYSMSDFAAARLENDGAEDEQWAAIVGEQTAFMRRFGVHSISSEANRTYELALLERSQPVLSEHKV